MGQFHEGMSQSRAPLYTYLGLCQVDKTKQQALGPCTFSYLVLFSPSVILLNHMNLDMMCFFYLTSDPDILIMFSIPTLNTQLKFAQLNQLKS